MALTDGLSPLSESVEALPVLPPAEPLTLARLQREVPYNARELAFGFRTVVPVLGREVRMQYAPDEGESWSLYGVEALQSVLDVPASDRTHLQDLLLESYRFHASVTDYGVDGDPDDPFEISDGAEAERRAGEPWVIVVDPFEPEGHRPRIAMVGYYPVWEEEHGVYVVVRDRQLVGLASDPYDRSAFDGRAK
ncbi:MAG: hypothetical protein Rubg2KO_19000 [Rubricoccaceae bacterium]